MRSIKKTKIMVLGVTGMLGHKVYQTFYDNDHFITWGTATSIAEIEELFPSHYKKNIIQGIYADKIESVKKEIFCKKPKVVINCIGIIKQKKQIENIKRAIVINSLFPHQLADICDKISAKLITISTDSVFDMQKKQYYIEEDTPACSNVYNMSKFLGEVNYGNHLTIRTSIIGHEIMSNLCLVDWFLNTNKKNIEGYKNVIFSGLTTLELSKILVNKIVRQKKMHGVYHLSTNPISKLELLKLIKKYYNKQINIIPNESIKINRTLNSDTLRKKIKYLPPNWESQIKEMHADFVSSSFYKHKRKEYENT